MTNRQKAKQTIKADIQEYHHDSILDYIEFQDMFWWDDLDLDDYDEWDY